MKTRAPGDLLKFAMGSEIAVIPSASAEKQIAYVKGMSIWYVPLLFDSPFLFPVSTLSEVLALTELTMKFGKQ